MDTKPKPPTEEIAPRSAPEKATVEEITAATEELARTQGLLDDLNVHLTNVVGERQQASEAVTRQEAAVKVAEDELARLRKDAEEVARAESAAVKSRDTLAESVQALDGWTKLAKAARKNAAAQIVADLLRETAEEQGVSMKNLLADVNERLSQPPAEKV